MQNSLNQAFIRAYAKERDAVHAQAVNSAADSQAAIERANEELILRIDTTSVEIPRPHITGRPSIKQNASAMAMAGAASAPSHARATRTEEDELRASIASEMLRAGGWQDEQIASLGPISPAPARPAATASNPMAAAPVTASPIASAPVAPAPYISNPDRQGPTSTTGSSFEPVQPMVATIAEDAEPRSNSFDRDSELLDTGTARFFSREAVRQSPPESVHGRPGSIVRLDKALGVPSAPEPPKPVAKTTAKPTPQSTEEVKAPKVEVEKQKQASAASTATVEPQTAKFSRATASAQAKHVEQELRRAKVRVFNPIWEVDQLQWPEVCAKLMESRMDSLNHVTKHLSEACQEGLQVLAVTSPEGGEGRTTVACCLAMLAGNRGLKVAIVDGDIENPTLCLQTNLEIENDWQSAIVNHLPLEEVSVHSIDDQITLIPLLAPLDQNELPGSDQRIADMLIELTESFDLVILDVGHMNSPNGLMSSLAEQGIINAAIAVVDNRNASPMRVETCIRRIRQAGVSSIGIVENFASSSQ